MTRKSGKRSVATLGLRFCLLVERHGGSLCVSALVSGKDRLFFKLLPTQEHFCITHIFKQFDCSVVAVTEAHNLICSMEKSSFQGKQNIKVIANSFGLFILLLCTFNC